MRYAEHRYAILFCTLIVSLGVAPLVQPFGLAGGIVEALLAANLVAAVLAVSRARVWGKVAIALVVVALVARPGALFLGEQGLATASFAIWGVLALLAAAAALQFALRGRSVGGEQVYAALSVYLLAGLFCGQLYWVLEQLVPGSLSVGGAPAPADMHVNTTIYFSFVTLASLGYGDILPLSDPARGLAMAEVVGGQLYLAVLVARLVSSWR